MVREGVLLHDSCRMTLSRPLVATPEERLRLGQRNFTYWFGSANNFYRLAAHCISQGPSYYNQAAFSLHQATERYYHALMLVFVHYKHRTHNIEDLGKKAAPLHPLLVDALPRTDPRDEDLFQQLKRAYIDSRYDPSYHITAEELALLKPRVRELGRRVRVACLEKLGSHRGPEAVSKDLPEALGEDAGPVPGLPPPPEDPADLSRWATWAQDVHSLGLHEGEKRGRDEGLREGEKRGHDQGLREGQRALRQAIADLCEMLGVEMTPERRAQMDGLDLGGLDHLRADLKATRAWPEQHGTGSHSGVQSSPRAAAIS